MTSTNLASECQRWVFSSSFGNSSYHLEGKLKAGPAGSRPVIRPYLGLSTFFLPKDVRVETYSYELVHKLKLFANVACHVSSERMADYMDIFDFDFLNIIKGDRNLPTNNSYVAATLWIIQSGKIFKILKSRKRTHVEEPFFQFKIIKFPFIFSWRASNISAIKITCFGT